MSSSGTTSYVTPAEGYRLWANTYDDEPNPMLSLEQRILESLLPPLVGMDVVDLGCGTGRWLKALQGAGARNLLGLDSSPEMLSVADSKLAGAANLVYANCGNASLEANSADVILATFVLSYVDDASHLVESASRALRPGGSIFITDIHPETAAALNWRRGIHGEREFHEIRTHPRTIEEIISMCEKTNLHAVLVLEPRFGNEERLIFEKNGKQEYFDQIKSFPAIYILQACAPKASTVQGPLRNTGSAYTSVEITSIRGGRFALGPSDSFSGEMRLAGSCVEQLSTEGRATPCKNSSDSGMDLTGFLVLPGLVNAHDHLEFALFPRLGKGGYKNFMEWADDIHHPPAPVIAEHRRVPREARLWWGGIRNLLCGVTSVCHHNPFEPDVFTSEFVVRVLRDYGWAHSLPLDPDAAVKKNETPEGQPFFLHLAEGVDEKCSREIFGLHSAGGLDYNTVVIHGLGLGLDGMKLLRSTGAGLIWCPSSNLFMFGKTLSAEEIRGLPNVAIGSDSPLTSCGDLLDEVHCASQLLPSSAEAIYGYVTRQPAKLLHLRSGEGNFRIGGLADLIAVRDTGLTPAETLLTLSHRDVELVFLGGRVQLASEEVMRRLPAGSREGLQPLAMEGIVRWIRAPLDRLFEQTCAHLGENICLGGKQVSIAR
jgi:cytosine/adenosine deaminase-related metal-dependent hydrolase/ubiquinone/menaquinone biosynthesis C-methylase UbiE